MPATYWTFERLGILDQMRQSAFPVKGSVQFYSPDGKAATPFYFAEHDPHESSNTWQVLRSDFDALLLDRAAADRSGDPHFARTMLRLVVRTAAEFNPITASVVLFAEGVADIHHLFRVHRISRGIADDAEARLVLSEVERKI